LIVASLVLATVLHCSKAQTGTNVNGVIGRDTAWNQAGSPYNFDGPVGISQGVTLTIQAGVTVNIGDNNYLQVNGTLDAQGTGSNPIHFNDGYIIFTNYCNSWNGHTETGCVIENSVSNSWIDIATASPMISYNNFTFSQLESGASVIGIFGSGAPIISNNIIDVTYGSQVYGINNLGSPLISNNTILF
jgi:hypothetical protein